jgi:hypothetical protein
MAKGKKSSKGKGKAAKKPASAPKKAAKRGPSKAHKAQAAKVSADAKKVTEAAKSVEAASKKVEAAAAKVSADAKKAKPKKSKAKSKASKKTSKSGSKAKRRSPKRKAAAKRPAPKRAAKSAAKSKARKGASKRKGGARKGKRKGGRKAAKKRSAPRRVTTQSKTRTTIQKKKSGRVKTTRKSSITKVWLKNPVNNWKNVAALSAATALGYVATDVLDRFIATMAPKAEGDKKTFAWTYGAAVKRINARPDAIRIGAQVGLAALAFGGAMWAQKKSEPAAYALVGLSLGAGVHVISQVATRYLMPMIFKVDPAKLTERSIGARLYASDQDFVQTPMLEAIKAENEKPASSPNQADDGKGNLPAAGQAGFVGRPGTPVARGGLPTGQARVMEPKARPRTGTVAGCAGCKAAQMEDAYDGPTATAIPGAGPDPMPHIPEAVVAPDAVLQIPSASVAPDQVMTMPRESTAPRGVSGAESEAPKPRRMSNEAFLLLGDPSANRDPYARRSN